jgi:outer membrane protein OmpA-like peptidoglycan-associated protein
MPPSEKPAQAEEPSAYWTPALQLRSQQLLAAGVKPVARTNLGLYKAAVARELREALGDGAGVEEAGNLVVLRLPAELAFDVGSSDLTPGAAQQLAACAPVFADYGLSVLEISGHTDNTGSAQINRKLSEGRARAVAEFLEARGVDPLRMVVEGRSDTQPLADNSDAQGRLSNRRVEIRVLPLVAIEAETVTSEEGTGRLKVDSPDPGAPGHVDAIH